MFRKPLPDQIDRLITVNDFAEIARLSRRQIDRLRTRRPGNFPREYELGTGSNKHRRYPPVPTFRGASLARQPGPVVIALHMKRHRPLPVAHARQPGARSPAPHFPNARTSAASPLQDHSGQRRMVTPFARHDLVAVRTPILPHDQRYQHTPRSYGGKDIGQIWGFTLGPHIGRRDGQMGDVDMLEFHFLHSFKTPQRAPEWRGERQERPQRPVEGAGLHPQGRNGMEHSGEAGVVARRDGPKGKRRSPRQIDAGGQRHRAQRDDRMRTNGPPQARIGKLAR